MRLGPLATQVVHHVREDLLQVAAGHPTNRPGQLREVRDSLHWFLESGAVSLLVGKQDYARPLAESGCGSAVAGPQAAGPVATGKGRPTIKCARPSPVRV